MINSLVHPTNILFSTFYEPGLVLDTRVITENNQTRKTKQFTLLSCSLHPVLQERNKINKGNIENITY